MGNCGIGCNLYISLLYWGCTLHLFYQAPWDQSADSKTTTLLYKGISNFLHHTFATLANKRATAGWEFNSITYCYSGINTFIPWGVKVI